MKKVRQTHRTRNPIYWIISNSLLRSQFALNNLWLCAETVLIWRPSSFGQKTHELKSSMVHHVLLRRSAPVSCHYWVSEQNAGSSTNSELGDNFNAAKSQIIYRDKLNRIAYTHFPRAIQLDGARLPSTTWLRCWNENRTYEYFALGDAKWMRQCVRCGIIELKTHDFSTKWSRNRV